MEREKLMMVVDQSMLEAIITEIKELKQLIQARSSNGYADEWITGKEVIKMLNISSKTLQNYRDRRIIPFTKIGKKIYYSKREINKQLNSKQSWKQD